MRTRGEGRVRVAVEARRRRALEGAIAVEVEPVSTVLAYAVLRRETVCLQGCNWST